MVSYGQKWLYVVKSGCMWLKVDKSGQKWFYVFKSGFMLLKMVVCG